MMIIKKNPLEHPALIFGFIRLDKILSSSKESIAVLSFRTATSYWYNTTSPFVTFLQWKYTSNRWMYLQHCVLSLLRIRVRNNGVQDNVYAIVGYFFVEPVAQL